MEDKLNNIDDGYSSADEKKKKSKGARLIIYQRLLSIDPLTMNDEQKEAWITEILPRLVRLALNSKKINPSKIYNSVNSNIYYLALQLGALEEIMPLLELRNFEPDKNLLNRVVSNLEKAETDLEKNILGMFLEKIILSGYPISRNANLFGNIRGTSITCYIKKKDHYLYNKQDDENDLRDKNNLNDNNDQYKEKILTCASCLDQIELNEPYFHNMANCSCALHLECAISFVESCFNNLQLENPLDRTLPRCPGCNLLIIPSFIGVFAQVIKELHFFNDDINFISSLPYIIQTHGKFLNEFIKKETPCSDMHLLIYPLMFRNHPNIVDCPVNEKCTGFKVINPGENKSNFKCHVCGKSANYEPKKNNHISKYERQLIKKLLSNPENKFQPCPMCYKLIEKNGGCNHMQCKHCNYDFSWMENPTQSLMKKARLF